VRAGIPLEAIVHLVVLSNRLDAYLPDTIDSLAAHVNGVDQLTVVDDSGDPMWREHVEATLGIDVVAVAAEPAGYQAAMQRVFDVAQGEHFALWEEDFRALEAIDLNEMARILDERPHLAQLALLRGPWYANEVAAGGVLQARANDGHEIELVDGVFEHRAFFTCNPTVLPRRTFTRTWPQRHFSEAAFGSELLRDPSTRFGMLPGIRVEHVGHERTGFNY